MRYLEFEYCFPCRLVYWRLGREQVTKRNDKCRTELLKTRIRGLPGGAKHWQLVTNPPPQGAPPYLGVASLVPGCSGPRGVPALRGRVPGCSRLNRLGGTGQET